MQHKSDTALIWHDTSWPNTVAVFTPRPSVWDVKSDFKNGFLV